MRSSDSRSFIACRWAEPIANDSRPAALLALLFPAPHHQAGRDAHGDDEADQPDFIERRDLEKDGGIGAGERRQREEQCGGGDNNLHFSPWFVTAFHSRWSAVAGQAALTRGLPADI